jgi:hypothetical protein
MTTRHPSFRHVRFTGRSRERHAQADAAAPPAYAVRVQTTVIPPATGQENLPLAGFYRLYGARRARKSTREIEEAKLLRHCFLYPCKASAASMLDGANTDVCLVVWQYAPRRLGQQVCW